ncbi:hypothetical protein C6341_g7612 [Phytophthora cactorum]|nr:hypothetical protein C6341_g7612 [Phytophthora cactorum]
MEANAAFVDAIYDAVKAHETYQSDFSGPYSLMCNAIEGCFSVLKAKIKSYLAIRHDEMLRGQMQELRMQLLEKATEHCMP